jgi:hypothetical protein
LNVRSVLSICRRAGCRSDADRGRDDGAIAERPDCERDRRQRSSGSQRSVQPRRRRLGQIVAKHVVDHPDDLDRGATRLAAGVDHQDAIANR